MNEEGADVGPLFAHHEEDVTMYRPQTREETIQQIRNAVANPERYETWRLSCLCSTANLLEMHEEEAALRAIVREREAKRVIRPAFEVIHEIN